ncbi:trypsin-like peptidase domain-containing protein [Patescibacteria group bacterium]|nr:trypsin-like peptidase domain-containing protein [Patescibacteria group bacterium]
MDSKKYSRSIILELIHESCIAKVLVILTLIAFIALVYNAVQLIRLSQPPTWKSSNEEPEGLTLLAKAFHSTIFLKTEIGTGTGWVLDSMVITAAHVVNNEGIKGDTVDIYFDDPIDPVRAIVVNNDPITDIAVLRPDTIPIHITKRICMRDLQERSSAPMSKDTFHGYGFPLSSFSRLQGIPKDDEFSFLLDRYAIQRIDANELDGASGAFLFSEHSWGLLRSTNKNDEHIMYLTPNNTILKMLLGTKSQPTYDDDIIWPDDDEDIDPQ